MLASDFPLTALTEPAPAGEVGARTVGRQLAVATAVLAWARQRGITTGGRLLATLELQPERAAQELGWTPSNVMLGARQLRDLFSRWP